MNDRLDVIPVAAGQAGPNPWHQNQAEPVCRAIELDLIPMSLQRIGSRRPVLLIRQRLLQVEDISLTGGMSATQAGLSGFDDGRRPVGNLKLAENRRNLIANCLGTEDQPFGDGVIGQPLGD